MTDEFSAICTEPRREHHFVVCWGNLGPSWAILGHLGAILGASWVNLGRSWGYLGAISGPSWAIPGPRKDRKWHECEYFLAEIYSDLNQTSDVHNNATQISNMSYMYERTDSCLSLHLFIYARTFVAIASYSLSFAMCAFRQQWAHRQLLIRYIFPRFSQSLQKNKYHICHLGAILDHHEATLGPFWDIVGACWAN